MISTAAVHNATVDTTSAAEHRGVRTPPAPPPDRPAGAGGASTSARDRGDRVSLSAEGLARSRRQPDGSAASEPDRASRGEQTTARALTPAEEQQVRELQQRDREVKAHEQAHLAVAGRHARGGASYTFAQGPDGRRYAVGGEVPIDVGAEPTPEASVAKMRTVRRAALAPAEPSPADRSIAAAAAAGEARALAELRAAQSRPGAAGSPEAATSGPPAASDGAENSRRRTPLAVIA